MIVRRLVAEDAEAICEIAQTISGFTVPSAYLIWMLSRTQAPLCKVATDERGRIVGYVLTIHTADPAEVFIWQLGLSRDRGLSASQILEQLCLSLIEDLRCKGVSFVRFTASSGQRTRTIHRIVRKLLSTQPKLTGPISRGEASAELCEMEYVVCINNQGSIS
jgi:hypothetical protein